MLLFAFWNYRPVVPAYAGAKVESAHYPYHFVCVTVPMRWSSILRCWKRRDDYTGELSDYEAD
jgi:hypothetical protein